MAKKFNDQGRPLGRPDNTNDLSSLDSDGYTSVDLGDDLIAGKTVILDRKSIADAPDSSSLESALPAEKSIADRLENARILFSEGMLEQAKRTLRSILLSDAKHAPARQLLGEIHDQELKQIFSSESFERSTILRASGDRGTREIVESASDVFQRLDEDLHLGMGAAPGDATYELSLFRELGETASLVGPGGEEVAARDRADLGISFMEMGLFHLAIRQFEVACHRQMTEAAGELSAEAALIEYTGLLARAQLAAGKPYEATMNLEPILRDTEVPHAAKLELLYLMGRAFEDLGQPEHARRWFAQVSRLDPAYRDLPEREARLRAKTRS